MTLYGSRGAATRDGIIYNSLSNSSMTYKRQQTNRPVTVNGLTPNNGQNWNSKVFGYTTSTAKRLDKTYYLGVPSNSECEANTEIAVYDTESDLITFNLPYFSRSELTASTTSASELTVKGTQTDHNFLTLFIQGEKYLSDGTTPFSYNIESIEITELGETIDADTVSGLEDSLGSSYKFTFGEDADQFNYNEVLNKTTSYKGLSYYPVWNYTDYDASGSNKPVITYKTMTDPDGNNGVDVLNIQGPTNAYITLLNKDGKPFEVLPGKEYKVSVKAYCETDTNYSQIYVSLGGNTNRTTQWFDDDYHNTNPTYTLYGSRGSTSQKNIIYNNGTAVTQPNRMVTDSQFTPNNGGTASTGHYGDNIYTARTASRTTYLGVPANVQCKTEDPVAVYDTATDLITFNLPLVAKNDLSTVTGTQVNHNFLTLFVSGSSYTDENGTVHPFSYSIESVEITEVGDSVKNRALTATATASTEEEEHPASLLNDGNTAEDNYWAPASDAVLSQNIQLSWRNLTSFDSVRLYELCQDGIYTANGFDILVSKDGVAWEKVYTGTVIGDSFEANFSRTVWAKHLKVVFAQHNDELLNHPAIREIEVYANGTGARSRNYAKSAELTASSTTTAGPLSNIIDGDKTNRYIPQDNASMPLSIQFKWDAAIAFDTVNIFEWKDGNGDYRANNIALEYSLDGSTWTPLYEGVGIGQELSVKRDTPVIAKYLCLKIKDIKEGLPEIYKPCICEIEILKTRDNANIFSFSSGSVATIDEENSKILLETVPGIDKTELTPVIKTESGATYTPAGARDFTNPVIYTVTSADGNIVRKYEVTVKEKDYLTDSDLSDKGSKDVSAFGPTPSPNQYDYQKQEMAAFCHFGMKTFLGLELVTKPYDISNWTLSTPADTDGYVKALKDAGFNKVIFTAKHHDGLCMWDTKWTDYNIMNTVYGRDFLAELSASCNKYDMDMGLYLQPWDVHSKYYGYFDENGNPCSEEEDVLDYNDFYAGQLEEILGNDKYGHNGKFNEIWLDGANLGNKPQTYDFDRYIDVMYKNEGEDVLIFGVLKAAKITWVGNESGVANEETWSKGLGKYNSETGKWEVTYYGPTVEYNGTGVCKGVKDGNVWLVNETDTVVTSGWFWGENKKAPKTLEQLRDIYLNSVGHNSVLLLNVPLNTSGTLDKEIKDRIFEFGQNVKNSFKTGNFLEEEGITVSASEVLNKDIKFKPSNVFDGNDNTYWTANEGTKEATLHIDFGKNVTFDSVVLEEAIQFGQRVESFKVLYKNSMGKWVEFTSGTTIGGKRVALQNAVTSSELLIYFTGMTDDGVVATPVISHVGVYKSTKDFEKKSGAPEGIESYDNTDDSVFTADGWTSVDDIDCISGGYISGGEGKTLTLNFKGTKAWLIGNHNKTPFSFEYSVDGGKAKTYTFTPHDYPSLTRNQILIETDDLSDANHTIEITVLSGTLEADALFVLNNGGKGYLEFENSSYTVNEDMSYEIKIVRKGGSKGSIKALIQDLPGSAVQTHYYNTEGLIINFAEGETEKTFTLRTMRYLEKTGTLSFSLEIVNADETDTDFAVGFNTPVAVYITDAEDYSGEYLNTFEIESFPEKTAYRVGDILDLTGLKVKAGYVTGDTRTLFEDQYTVSHTTLDKAGAVLITVSSKYGGKTATFTVTVFANGDVDQNGYIDITDLVRLSLGAEDTGDLDRNGKIDTADSALLRKHLIGKESLTAENTGAMDDLAGNTDWTEGESATDTSISEVVLNKLDELGANLGGSIYVSDFDSESTASAGTLPSGWQFGKGSGLDWNSNATNASVKELKIDADGTTKKGINIYSNNGGSTVISTTPLGTNNYAMRATFYYISGRHSSEANFRFFNNVSDTSLRSGVKANNIVFYGETTSGTYQQPSILCNSKWYNTASLVGSNIGPYTKVDIELVSYNGYNHYFINGKLMASVEKTDRGINDDVIGFTAWCADYHITDVSVYALSSETASVTKVSEAVSAKHIVVETAADVLKNADVKVEKLDENGKVVDTFTVNKNSVIYGESGFTYRVLITAKDASVIDGLLKRGGIRILSAEKLEISRYSAYASLS